MEYDAFKDSIEGCPKKFNPRNEICKECTMIGDCKREWAENLASDPEELGKIMAQAQVISNKILRKEAEEELKKMELGKGEYGKGEFGYLRGFVRPPRPNLTEDIDGFLDLFTKFTRKMEEKGIVIHFIDSSSDINNDIGFALFKLFLTTPTYLYDEIEPLPAEPEPPPPRTPEEVEEDILEQKSPEECYLYAMGILYPSRKFGRFEAGEEIIRKSPEFAYKYALNVLKKPWPEAEEIIARHPEWACCYAMYLLEGRFRAAENIIVTNPEFSYRYARTVLGKRWTMFLQGTAFAVMAEDTILADPEWGKEYKDYFQIKT